VLLAESKNMGTPLHCMSELGVSLMGSKVLKKTSKSSSVPCFSESLQLPDWSNSTVEEKLRPCLPQKAYSSEIYVCLDIELVGCLWTIRILGQYAYTILLIVGKVQIHIMMYTMIYICTYIIIYTVLYLMVNTRVYTVVYTMFKHLRILSLKAMSWQIK
jgi:hypothetical protein